MSEPSGLSKETVSALQRVFEKYSKIRAVTLFGSRAKGTFKNNSDIDLALHGEELDLSDLLQIENEIDDLLLPYTVDLLLFHKIENLDLTEHIRRVGKVFYQR